MAGGEGHRDEKLTTFLAVTGVTDRSQAQRVLEENNWDLDRAVNYQLAGLATNDQQQAASNTNARRNIVEEADHSGILGTVVNLMFSPIRLLLGAKAMHQGEKTPTATFIEYFDSEYGKEHATFIPHPYRSAVTRAQNQAKFLLVYLHSEHHSDSAEYCRDVVCDTNIVKFANDHCVSWIGNVASADAWSACSHLGVCKFPFMALIAVVKNGSMPPTITVVERCEGVMQAGIVLGRLERARTVSNNLLASARAEAGAKRAAAELREEQDRDFKEALEADRKRAQDAETEKREAREKEEREEQERQLEEAKQLSIEGQKQADFARKKETMKEEPAKGAPNTTQLRITLPKGQKLERRFEFEATVQDLWDWIDVMLHDNGHGIENYSLNTNFPKRKYGPDDATLTLKEADLVPRAALFLQDLDA